MSDEEFANVLNTTPLTMEQLAELSGASIESVKSFFESEFGGYDRYVETCKDPKGLELSLKRLIEEYGDRDE